MLAKIKNQEIQNYLENLRENETTDYSLWKPTRKHKEPQQSTLPIKDENNKWATNKYAIVFVTLAS